MTDSKFVKHEPCTQCGSKNNLARYDDGHAYCFGCGYYVSGDGMEVVVEAKPRRAMETVGTIGAISDRKISKATCELFGVTVEYNTDGSISKHHYVYHDRDTGEPIGSKVRTTATKDFYSTGSFSNSGLFGQRLWGEGGKAITITEGELDALAVSEMFNNKFPVVSIRSGAKGAVKDIKENLEWLESYDSVIICFDNDKVGQEAANAVLPLFSPNKAKNVTLPLKDAGEMLKDNRIKQFTSCWYEARTFKPDGIVSGKDTWDLIESQKDVVSIPYPWQDLNEITYGFRQKELVTITSGSGMGKSQIMRELEHYLIKNTKDNVGILALEESVDKTALGIMSVEANLPLHLPTTVISKEDKRAAFDNTLNNDRVFLLDHFGSTSEDNLLSKVRYLAKGLDCKWIILDHLSIVVSGEDTGDERKAIDVIMTRLRQLVQETGIGLFLVSHLKRPSGKGHEEGAQVSLAELRGSAAIAQLSDMVIGLERNQQHEDEEVRNTTTVRVLKNRFAGLTGIGCYLYYDKHTGRMIQTGIPTGNDSDMEF